MLPVGLGVHPGPVGRKQEGGLLVTQQRKQKILAFVPSHTVERFERMARRYRLSKSQLYCEAIERGVEATAEWCSRTYPVIEESGRPSGSSFPDRGSGSGHPLGALASYAEALASQMPDATEDVYRNMLVTQAGVLGLSPALVASVVDGLVRDRFGAPQGAPGPAVSGDLAGVPDLD